MAQNLLTRSNPTTRPKGKDGKDGKFREPLDVFVAMKVDQITDVDTITGRVYVKLDVIFMWDDDRFPVERPIPKGARTCAHPCARARLGRAPVRFSHATHPCTISLFPLLSSCVCSVLRFWQTRGARTCGCTTR